MALWQQAKGKRAEMNAGSFCLFEFFDRIGKTNGENLGEWEDSELCVGPSKPLNTMLI